MTNKEKLLLLKNQNYESLEKELINDFLSVPFGKLMSKYNHQNKCYTLEYAGSIYNIITDNCSIYLVNNRKFDRYIINNLSSQEWSNGVKNLINNLINNFDDNDNDDFCYYFKHINDNDTFEINGNKYTSKYLELYCQLNDKKGFTYSIDKNGFLYILEARYIKAIILPIKPS
jgi:hypothetical protein